MNTLFRCFGIAILVGLAGCSTPGKRPTESTAEPSAFLAVAKTGTRPEGKPVLRAVLLDDCPLTPKERRPEALGTLGTTILKTIGDMFVSKLFDAIADAAKRDREGITVSGSNGQHFYSLTKDQKSGLWSWTSNRCIVVMRGTPVAGASDARLCEGSPFNQCAAEGGQPEEIAKIEKAFRLTKPTFYAEIFLTSHNASSAVAGKLGLVWYPSALGKRRGTTRDLLLSVAMRKPHPETGKGEVYAGFYFALPELTPNQEVLLPPGYNWLRPYTGSVPPFPNKDELARLDAAGQLKADGEPAGMVNLEVSLNETGDVNALLQFAAELLAKDPIKNEITTRLQSLYDPSINQAAEAATAAARSTAALTLCTVHAEARELEANRTLAEAAWRAKLTLIDFRWQAADQGALAAGLISSDPTYTACRFSPGTRTRE